MTTDKHWMNNPWNGRIMTMTTTHTPGPWQSETHDGPQNKYSPSVAIHKDGYYIASVRLVSIGYSGTEADRKITEANAHLIAAAPELLDALEFQLASVNDMLNWPDHKEEYRRACLTNMRDDIEAAIAKAKGQ